MTPQKRQASFTGEIVHFDVWEIIKINDFLLLVKLQKALFFSLLYKMIFSLSIRSVIKTAAFFFKRISCIIKTALFLFSMSEIAP
jgi:hypothetical protein